MLVSAWFVQSEHAVPVCVAAASPRAVTRAVLCETLVGNLRTLTHTCIANVSFSDSRCGRESTLLEARKNQALGPINIPNDVPNGYICILCCR
jgi:hypothetical protein